MPSYNKNKATAPPVKMLVAGKPDYLFGSWNDEIAPSQFGITNSVSNGTTATLTGILKSGNIPAVGDLINVAGTTGGSGALNVADTALSAVSITPSTGQGTVSFLSAASFSTQADGGYALIQPQENFEAIANGSSIPVTVQFNDPETNTGRTVTLIINTPANTLTGTVVAQLAAALYDRDSDYVLIGTSISIPTTAQIKSQQYTLGNYRFYRLTISGATGGAGTICAKLM